LSELRFGIIGLGHWGPNYARLLRGQVPDARLVACADLRPASLDTIARLYPDVDRYTDHRRMLARGDLDAVVVATSARAHRTVAEDCLRGGLHVLVEKPLADTGEAAEAIVELAERSGRTLMVGHTFLFNPAVEHVKRSIDQGHLGRVLYLSFRRTGLGPIRQDVNALWDLAPHDLSMLSFWLDAEPTDVTARGQCYLRPDIEDVVFITLRFPGDVLVGIQLSWLDPVKDRRVTIVGDRRMVVFDDVSTTEKLRVYDRGVTYQPAGGDFSGFLTSVRDGDIVIPNIDRYEPLAAELEHFVRCIETGTTPRADGRQGLAICRILERAQADLGPRAAARLAR